MTRLTTAIREQMARKLVAHRFTDEAKELVRLNHKLMAKVHQHCYPKDLLKHMEAVRKHYPKAFHKHVKLHVNAGGYQSYVGGIIHNRWVKVEQAEPTEYLAVGGRYDPARHDITDEQLIAEIQEFLTRRDGFSKACETAYNEALAALNTMTTGKKLAEAWPEALPVIGDLIPESQRTLPVVQMSAINAKFKLPPEQQTK